MTSQSLEVIEKATITTIVRVRCGGCTIWDEETIDGRVSPEQVEDIIKATGFHLVFDAILGHPFYQCSACYWERH